MAVEVDVSSVAVDVSSVLEQESIRPKANAKIVGRKSNCSFFIGAKFVLCE